MCTIYLEPIDGAWLELAVALAVPLLAVLRPHLRWRWKLMVDDDDGKIEDLR